MATKDVFDPSGSLPLFLSAVRPEQEIGTNRAVILLRGLMVAAAIAICIAILSNQVALLSDVTASLVDKSAPQPGTDQSTPIIQSVAFRSTADAEALPATANDAPDREISTSERASQTETENKEALFRQFQAWAAEQDARALAKLAQDTPAPVRPLQKQPRVRSVQDARAQNQSAQNAESPSFLQSLFGASPPQHRPRGNQ
jgi:hypothetical protein